MHVSTARRKLKEFHYEQPRKLVALSDTRFSFVDHYGLYHVYDAELDAVIPVKIDKKKQEVDHV